MELKEILLAAGLGLSPLFTSQNIYAQEVAKVEKPAIENAVVESEIIKPSLEEIARLIEKFPAEILKEEINNGNIKKFEYTRQTTNNDFYKFINKNFNNRVLFLYVATDDPLCLRIERDRWAKESTFNQKAISGAAISFLYINKNLQERNKDVGFLFFELKDFRGDEMWAKVKKLFNWDRVEFPSYAEFNKDSRGRYKFEKIGGCGVKSPNKIHESINWGIDRYTKSFEEMLKTPF